MDDVCQFGPSSEIFFFRYFYSLNKGCLNPCSEVVTVLTGHLILFVVAIYSLALRNAPHREIESIWKINLLKPQVLTSLIAHIVLTIQFVICIFFNQFALSKLSYIEHFFVLIIWTFFITFRLLRNQHQSAVRLSAYLLALISMFVMAVQRLKYFGFWDARSFPLFFSHFLHVCSFLFEFYRVDARPDLTYRNLTSLVLEKNDEDFGFFNRLFFVWTNDLVKKGYQRQLASTNDLYRVPNYLEPKFIGEELNQIAIYQTSKFSIARYLFHLFGSKIGLLGVFKLVGDLIRLSNPILLHALIDSIGNDQERGNSIWIVILMAAALFVSSVLDFNFNFFVNKMALRIRSVILLAVYGKLLRVSKVNASKANLSSGKLLNFVSTDIDRAVNFFTSFHSLWSMPLSVIIALLLLYREVGIAFLSGLLAALTLIPINKLIADRIGTVSQRMMTMKDERLKLVNEFVRSVKTIRLNSWEQFFGNRISGVRTKELKCLMWKKYLDAICVYLWAATPVVITLAILITFVWVMGGQLTAAKVFTTLALVNVLILPLNAFPWALNSFVEAMVSKRRFDLLFSLENLTDINTFEDNESFHDENSEMVLKLKDVSFSWADERPILKNLSFFGNKGQIIGVIGPVGSGKSTLLEGILGEALCVHLAQRENNIPVQFKKFSLTGGLGYVGQDHWLRRQTVKQNIIVDKKYDPLFYRLVVESCALSLDIETMPGKDEFVVGNDGTSLSGGQRTRIELARAAYQRCGIYLLDDPFASLDQKVSSHIFEKCVKGILQQSGALVILCTHHHRFIREADWVIKLDSGGSVLAQGRPSDILNISNELQQNALECEDGGQTVDEGSNSPEHIIVEKEEEKQEGTVRIEVYKTYLSAVGFWLSIGVFASMITMQLTKNGSDVWLGVWAKKSRNSSAKVFDFEIHLQSSSAVNNSHLTGFFAIGPIWSLIAPSTVQNTSNDGEALIIYILIAVANTFCALVRAFLFAYGGLVAARSIHQKLLCVLNAQFSWWDATPSGRVVNRFSSDVFMVDDSLPFQLNILLATTFGLAGILLLTTFALPLILPLAIVLSIVYFFIQRYYRFTTVELKRLGSITLSPLYHHVTDTVSGLVSIRAYRFEDHFTNTLFDLLRENMKAQYAQLACSQWLSVRLQLIGVFTVSAIGLGSIAQLKFFGADTALVSLAITYALSIMTILNALLNSFIETEKELVSVERISEYIERVPVEEDKQQPSAGESVESLLPFDTIFLRSIGGGINFYGTINYTKLLVFLSAIFDSQLCWCTICVNFSYGPGMPLVLRDVTFNVNPGEKIAICGRTGSGKSSIFLALLRAYPLQSGKIWIDGVGVLDASSLELRTFRSLFGYISQAPFIFSGTVRENLLMKSERSSVEEDAAIESLLQKAGLGDWLRRIEGLDAALTVSGLSRGESQLICLCRLILQKPKIVLIDEATAHIDEQQHLWLMEELLKLLAPETTILCILHRLSHLEKFDRVIEMSNGSISRQGTASELGL